MPKQEDSSLTEKSVLQKELNRIEAKRENSRNQMNFLIQKKTFIENEIDAPEISTKNECIQSKLLFENFEKEFMG
jgi:hypothetical protein